MTAHNCRSHRPQHLFESAACDDSCDLFAHFRHVPLSWYARCLAESSPPQSLLAHCHASPLPRTQNRGRTRPLDASRGDVLALGTCAEGNLLGCPSAGGMVGTESPEHLATPRGRRDHTD